MDTNVSLLSFGMKPGAFDRGEGPIVSGMGGKESARGLAKNEFGVDPERREDGSRERRCPNHDRRRVRTSRFRGVQETVVAHGEEREKTKGHPFGYPVRSTTLRL